MGAYFMKMAKILTWDIFRYFVWFWNFGNYRRKNRQQCWEE